MVMCFDITGTLECKVNDMVLTAGEREYPVSRGRTNPGGAPHDDKGVLNFCGSSFKGANSFSIRWAV
jgi:hypothetical protein